MCYFHRVSLICSADNMFMRKVIIIHYIYCISDWGIPLVSKITHFSDTRSPPIPPIPPLPCPLWWGLKGQKFFNLILLHCWERHLRHIPVILSSSRPLLFWSLFSFWVPEQATKASYTFENLLTWLHMTAWPGIGNYTSCAWLASNE